MSSAFYVTTVINGTSLQVIVNAVAGSSIESADLVVSYLAGSGTFTGATGPAGCETLANPANGMLIQAHALVRRPPRAGGGGRRGAGGWCGPGAGPTERRPSACRIVLRCSMSRSPRRCLMPACRKHFFSEEKKQKTFHSFEQTLSEK
jgi:hypothetical protein